MNAYPVRTRHLSPNVQAKVHRFEGRTSLVQRRAKMFETKSENIARKNANDKTKTIHATKKVTLRALRAPSPAPEEPVVVEQRDPSITEEESTSSALSSLSSRDMEDKAFE